MTLTPQGEMIALYSGLIFRRAKMKKNVSDPGRYTLLKKECSLNPCILFKKTSHAV
jgi:hypothetical protein